MTTITEPGIYPDLPGDVYHADPVPEGSLSASGAKLLLPPHVPADFNYARKHGQAPRGAFDFGHLAHRKVLGIGDEYEIVHKVTRDKQRVPADTFDTVSAKQHIEEIRAAGKVPVLESWLAVVEDMAVAIQRHPEAHALLTSGKPEQSAFWRDEQHGIWRRCRFDVLPEVSGRRMVIPDYKTAVSAAPALFNKRIHDYGYALQDAQYTEAVRVLLGEPDPAFVFVVQQKSAPYHVAVIEPDEDWLRIGRERMNRAARTYAHCTATGEWPAYPGIHSVSPPPWVENAHDAEMTEYEETA